jgi:hypothetical protein
MLKSKLSAFLSLLVVFISGGVVGALVYRAYNPPQQGPPPPEIIRKRIVDDMQAKLHLDDRQVTELQKIMDDIRAQGEQLRKVEGEEFHKIRVHQVDEIKKILRDDQQPLYEKWLQDREADRKRQQQGKKGFRPPDR